MDRSKPWQIAADLEAASRAALDLSIMLDSIDRSALAEVEDIPGAQWIDKELARAIQALSDKYQAIADAEETL